MLDVEGRVSQRAALGFSQGRANEQRVEKLVETIGRMTR